MKEIEQALVRYVNRLDASAARTTQANDRPSYTQHLAAAARMFASLHSNAPLATLKSLVADEREAYGRFFLTSDAGKAAEAAFDEFAKQVEAA